jgi:rhamnosyltransferase
MIDILMATYNGADYIESQIKSIQQQTFDDWELMISDDGSSDGTVDVIKKAVVEDNRIKSVVTGIRHYSASAHFLHLLNFAKNDYFAFSDQDDYWLKEKLALSMAELKHLESTFGEDVPLMVYSDMIVVDENLNVISTSYWKQSGKVMRNDCLEQLLNTNTVAGCTIVGNKALRILVTSQNHDGDNDMILMHDWWIALIASCCGYSTRLSRPTVMYRQHGTNSVGAEKYSFFDKVKRFHVNASKYWLSCRQAELLYRMYGGFMRPHVRQTVAAYSSLPRIPIWKDLVLLRKYHLFKENLLKKLGQIGTIIFMHPTITR